MTANFLDRFKNRIQKVTKAGEIDFKMQHPIDQNLSIRKIHHYHFSPNNSYYRFRNSSPSIRTKYSQIHSPSNKYSEEILRSNLPFLKPPTSTGSVTRGKKLESYFNSSFPLKYSQKRSVTFEKLTRHNTFNLKH